jgi:hypothetical protein
MIARLTERANRIGSLLEQLLLEHSGLRDMNEPGSGVAVVGRSHAWQPLDLDGRRLQSQLLLELETYVPLVEALVRLAPERARKDVAEANQTIRDVVGRAGS